MASQINASNSGFGGIVSTGDSSGVLQLQTTGTTAVTIDTSQNVGIGTATVASGRKLQLEASGDTIQRINSGGASSGLSVEFANNGTLRGGIGNGSGNISGGSATTFAVQAVNELVFASGGYSERMRIDSSGNLLVGASSGGQTTRMRLKYGSGQTWALGPLDSAPDLFFVANTIGTGVYVSSGNTSWTANSDERKKDIIEPITNAIEKVSTLRAVIGKYKTDEEDKRRSFLIAQDVQAVLPEAVDASNPDNLGIQYTEVIPLLVAAIKEQQTIINDLKARIEILEAK